MHRALITLATAIVMLAGGSSLLDAVTGGPFADRALAQTKQSWWPFNRPLAKAEDSGYFFRLKVSLTYQNAPLNFDIVVGCGVRATQYADKTRTLEVALVAPTYYVEQVAGGHAIGVRPPQACAGHSSDDGNIPAMARQSG